jgi:PAS domain-containing protein
LIKVQSDQDGTPERMIGINVDVTNQKRIEDALRESEVRFRALMDNSPATAWMKDAQGRYVYFSKAYERRHKLRLRDCSNKTDAEIFPPGLLNNSATMT